MIVLYAYGPTSSAYAIADGEIESTFQAAKKKEDFICSNELFITRCRLGFVRKEIDSLIVVVSGKSFPIEKNGQMSQEYWESHIDVGMDLLRSHINLGGLAKLAAAQISSVCVRKDVRVRVPHPLPS